jgi:hypothetical protein
LLSRGCPLRSALSTPRPQQVAARGGTNKGADATWTGVVVTATTANARPAGILIFWVVYIDDDPGPTEMVPP